MPVIEVRRKDRQATNEEALALIQNAAFGHLATISSDGYPYVIPVNHALVDGTLLIHSAVSGQKIENIERDSRVCFEVSNMLELVPGPVPCAYSARYESAVAFGKARIVKDAEEKRRALGLISKKYSGKDGPFDDKEIERVAIIVVDIEAATAKMRR